MFQVIEFAESSGGGVAVVRREWLTPRKKECFWPPEKQSRAFDKILLDGRAPEQNWQLYKIRRIFAVTDDLAVAKQKEQKSLNESDLQSDSTEPTRVKRKRTIPAKLVYSSSEEEDGQPNAKTKNLLEISLPDVGLLDDSQNEGDESLVGSPHINLSFPKTSHPSKTGLKTPSVIKPSTSTPGANLIKPCSSNNFNSGDESLADFSGDNLSCPIQVPRRAKTGEVIAKHLAKIEQRIEVIYENQQVILKQLGLSPAGTPNSENNNLLGNLKLPCNSQGDVECLEQWLVENDDNKKALDKHMTLCGGKKPKLIVTRILQKLFTNSLAVEYNWTGKNAKRPLKSLKFIEMIPSAVRKNFLTNNATDAEIITVIQNWFRFVKDRDGGRERRRIRNEEERAGE